MAGQAPLYPGPGPPPLLRRQAVAHGLPERSAPAGAVAQGASLGVGGGMVARQQMVGLGAPD